MTRTITAPILLAGVLWGCGQGGIEKKPDTGGSGERKQDAIAACIAAHEDEWPRNALFYQVPEGGSLCLLIEERLSAVDEEERLAITAFLALVDEVDDQRDFGEAVAGRYVSQYLDNHHRRGELSLFLEGIKALRKVDYIGPNPLHVLWEVNDADLGVAIPFFDILAHYNAFLAPCREGYDEDDKGCAEDLVGLAFQEAQNAARYNLNFEHVSMEARTIWRAIERTRTWSGEHPSLAQALVYTYHSIAQTTSRVVDLNVWPQTSELLDLVSVMKDRSSLGASCLSSEGDLVIAPCLDAAYFAVYGATRPRDTIASCEEAACKE